MMDKIIHRFLKMQAEFFVHIYITSNTGGSMLFSLQRQDKLFRSLRQEGHIAAPHQHYRLVSSRSLGSSRAPLFIPQRVVGLEGIHSWLTLKRRLVSWCLVSLQKFWSQSQVRLSTRWGPRTEGLCFEYPACWTLLTSRYFFST